MWPHVCPHVCEQVDMSSPPCEQLAELSSWSPVREAFKHSQTCHLCRSPGGALADSSTGLEGQSYDLSHDLSLTRPLSRTQSFLSTALSDPGLSPTAGHLSSHVSPFLNTQLPCFGDAAAAKGSKTAVAGLTLFARSNRGRALLSGRGGGDISGALPMCGAVQGARGNSSGVGNSGLTTAGRLLLDTMHSDVGSEARHLLCRHFVHVPGSRGTACRFCWFADSAPAAFQHMLRWHAACPRSRHRVFRCGPR
jgi:hypothetical protein